MTIDTIIFNLLFDANDDNRTIFKYSSNWKCSIFTDLNEQQFYEHFRITKASLFGYVDSYTRKLLRFH